MVIIEFSEPNTSEWREWRRRAEELTQEIKDAYTNGHPLPEVGAHYHHDTVMYAMRSAFHNKCAYCESGLGVSSAPQIEHYRPHKAVHDVSRKPISNHQGYRWLGYEWTNFLFSCAKCNGRGGKGNRFPLKSGSNYALSPTHNISLEEPLLLNPVCYGNRPLNFAHNPELHLGFDTNTGELTYKTPEGEISIKVYGLNDNKRELAQKRMSAYKEVGALFQDSAICLKNGRIDLLMGNFAKLRAIDKGEAEYSFAGRKAIDDIKADPYFQEFLDMFHH